MTETTESLKEMGGIDLTKLPIGVKVLVETTVGIYEMTVTGPNGLVSVKATVPPFSAQKAVDTCLDRSIWDDKGDVSIPHWVGRGMRMVFKDDDNKLFATHSVESARVESADGSWAYEIWETKT